MPKLDLKSVPKLKPDPVFSTLPESLKDPARFDEIESYLAQIVKSDHKHKTALAYAKCDDCQKKFQERRTYLSKVGFTSTLQYYQWKKVQLIIKNKQNFPLK